MNSNVKKSLYLCALSAAVCLPGVAVARGQESTAPLQYSSSAATFSNFTSEELPDAPSAMLAAGESGQPAGVQVVRTKPARKFTSVIRPDEIAQPLTAGDKFTLALVNQLTLANLGTTVISAGLTQWRDGRPHYGTDSGAFGERVGASALKGLTQSVFSVGIYAPIFHDDPRYYVMGPGNKLTKRAVYSASRLFVTKKDDGSRAVNWSRLGGIMSAAALTNAYYPDQDRGAKNTIYSIFTTFGTTALTFELREFIGDARNLMHHKK